MKSLIIDIDDKSSENTLTDRLKEIDASNQSEIKLEVKSDSNKKTEKINLNVHLFNKIKEIQDLPDWVIVKLLLAKGKLVSGDFRNRILND